MHELCQNYLRYLIWVRFQEVPDIFFSSPRPERLCSPRSLLSNSTAGFISGCKALTIHPHLMPKIKKKIPEFYLHKNVGCSTRPSPLSYISILLSRSFSPSDRRLSDKLVPTFADRRCRVVSATDPDGRILGFLDRSRYYFLQLLTRLSGPRSKTTTSQKIW
jgi:hypothetical protein